MAKFDDKENLIPLIKATPVDKLQLIADELRTELLDDVSVSGGHLASNLGVVELTVALHKVFDSPKDKIVWDVGHQCYVHKMITGRRDEMKNIRHLGGISGFPKRAESSHDIYDSGHSSTSISVALGLAKARDLKDEDYSCIAVIGDGALTGGVAFEALNHAGDTKTPLIVILNDNQMSIGDSVGGTQHSLERLRTSKTYLAFKNILKKTQFKAPGLYYFLKRIRDSIKYLFLPNQVFEGFGFKYYGPIDGHDIAELVDALEFAKNAKRSIVLHVLTQKGKGFKPAEDNPTKYHGVSSFDLNTANSESDPKGRSWSEIFGDELLNLALKDDKIVGISAAMVDSTGLSDMAGVYPERVFDVGIAEQHAVSFAEGLALNGMKPVVAIYSTFLQRAYDEILTEVCLQDLPIVFAIDRAGVTGSDGETHQGVFDIAYLSSMPNMMILSPWDENSLRGSLDFALKQNHPVAIRYGKGSVPKSNTIENEYIPSVKLQKEGFEALIISDGAFVSECKEAAEMIKTNSVAVCNLEVLKPLNKEFITSMLKNYKAVITVEDGALIGGFGEEISSMAAESKEYCKVLNLGWPDKFIEHGSVSELRKKYGLDTLSIKEKVEAFLETKA